MDSLQSIGSSRGRGDGEGLVDPRARPRSAGGRPPPRSRRRAPGWRPWGSRTARAAAPGTAARPGAGSRRGAAAISCSTRPPSVSRAREIAVAERAVGDHGDAVLLAPGEHGVLDGALLQVVEDLVAGDAALAGDLAGPLPGRARRSCSRPRRGSSPRPELLEGGERLLQRVLARASAAGSSPAGRSRGGRATARRPRSSRSARRSAGGPWRPGRPRRAARRSPRRRSPRRPPYISAVSMWVMPRSRPRRRAATAVGAIAAVDVPGPLADHRRPRDRWGRSDAVPWPISPLSDCAPRLGRLDLRRSPVRAVARSPTWAGRRRCDRPPGPP